jgi:hypothetical protein
VALDRPFVASCPSVITPAPPSVGRAALLVAVVAGTLAATAAAAPAVNYAHATYRGRTAQGIAVQLGPQRSFGRAFRYRARMSCSDGSKFLDSYFTDDITVRHNRFSTRVSSSGGAVITKVTGTLQQNRAHGTVRIVERYSEIPTPQGDTPLSADGAIVCDSHAVRWNATARR